MKRKEKRTFYNFQFKRTAVMITKHPNIQSIDIAEALRTHAIMLYRWRREMREGQLENNAHFGAFAGQIAAGRAKNQEIRAGIKAGWGRERGAQESREDLSRKR
jgi:transposase-like protein